MSMTLKDGNKRLAVVQYALFNRKIAIHALLQSWFFLQIPVILQLGMIQLKNKMVQKFLLHNVLVEEIEVVVL